MVYHTRIGDILKGGLADQILRWAQPSAAQCAQVKEVLVGLRPLVFWDVAGMLMVFGGGASLGLNLLNRDIGRKINLEVEWF